jgi:S1-C subfamily serine protease
VREILDLTSKVGDYEPGDTGPVEVLRGGERLSLEVTYDVVRHGR